MNHDVDTYNFNPSDYATDDFSHFDQDPDIHYFSSFNISKSCKFYNEAQFNNMCVSLPSNIFSTFHLNIRSLSCNFDKLVHYLSLLKHNFSVIAITETWLTDNSKEMFKLSNYNPVHRVRDKRPGGGVSLFILRDHGFKMRHDLSLKSNSVEIESLFIELIGVVGIKNIIVGVIYRPPDQSIRDFNESLSNCLDRIIKENKYCYILGDFNINLLKHNTDTVTREFLNILHSSYFFPLILKSTRVKNNSVTLIDNILTNTLSEEMESGVFLVELSDHFPIFHFTNLNFNKIKQDNRLHKRVHSEKT